MFDVQEKKSRMKKGRLSLISASDIWKQTVMLDAIRASRKAKSRISRYF